MESVRYAATLDTGEGFLAFAGGYAITAEPIMETGEVELPKGSRILPDIFDVVWPFPKLRRMVPADGEYVYLTGSVPPDAKMVTDVDFAYLVGTDYPITDAIWGGKVTEYAFDRAAYIELALA